MMNLYLRAIFVVVWLTVSTGLAQNVVRFELIPNVAESATGETFEATVRAHVESGWHLYSMDVPAGGPIPTSLTVQENSSFVAGGVPTEPTPIPWFDQNFGMQTNYFEGQVDFTVPVLVKQSSPLGSQELSIKIRFMACDDSSCLPPQNKTVTGSVNIVQGSSYEAGQVGLAPPAADSPEVVGVEEPKEKIDDNVDASGIPLGTLAYIWFAMGMGALALLTPCVFPMIPITVSYFTKRDAKTRARAVFEAALYSFGIIATFTLLGFILTYVFGAGGINKLAASPLVNLFIAAVFLVFALSLFGVIELAIPSSWLSAINRKSSETGGVLGIFFMALTFSLTSFTCTVPFVGTVMVAALQGDVLWSLLGVTAFATVFSLPFFVLALFPSWLQTLPKSGNWMVSVKVTMGFLELAAALKFISNVDLVFQWELITRPVFITVWLAIGMATVFYLLGWFRFAHEGPGESVGVTRLFFALFFLAVSFYLLRGLLGFSLGELDAFLPPRDYGAVAQESFLTGPRIAGEIEEEIWFSDYDEALRVSREQNRPIFIDFTGYTCTNCRWMEANIFPLPEVQELFSQFVLVRLYTDGTKPEHERNRQMEEERFKTIALPYYALMSPSDDVIATFPGLTRDENEFIRFLKKGLAG